MPMRGELVAPIAQLSDEAWDRDAWTVIVFCAVGLFMTVLLAAHDPSILALEYGPF
jgi:hypothetical protein